MSWPNDVTFQHNDRDLLTVKYSFTPSYTFLNLVTGVEFLADINRR